MLFLLALLLFQSSMAIAQNKPNLKSDPATVAFTVPEKDLFPEGITYDAKTKLFFLSSIHKNKVVAVYSDNKCVDFISPGQDGMLRSLGMKVDAQRRRLWIVSNSDWGESMISAIHIYNIDTRKLIKSFFTNKGKAPTFNDLALTASGGAFISDYGGNSIYQVPANLSRVELFLKSDSLLSGANGMAITPDNSLLYVASNTKGIVIVDLKIKSVQAIITRLPADTRGIDGLMIYHNSLIGVFNGNSDMGKHRISRYMLSPNGYEIASLSIVDQGNPLFNEPTSGVIVGDELYCLAATYLRQFVMDRSMDMAKLKNPIVLKYKLLNDSGK